MSRATRTARRLVARGYDVRTPDGPTSWWDVDGSPLVDAAERLGGRTLAVVLPTTDQRCTPADLRSWVTDVVAQLRTTVQALPGERPVVLVVLQHAPGAPDAAVAAVRDLPQDDDVLVLAATTPVRGKVRALNAAVTLLAGRCTAVGWVDDDVRLDPGCLARLVAELRSSGGPVAVGARKSPGTTSHTTSRVLARAKRLMPSAMNYPHGCCMVVTADVLADGIPRRYVCDDGWVCFRLLDPVGPDPFARLRLVPDAVCHYTVGGAAGPTWHRLRRQRVSQLVLVADADEATARCYVRRALLHGVRLWPGEVPPGGRRSDEVVRAVVSWVHVVTTVSLAVELAVRGLVGRPVRHVRWGTTPEERA